LSDQTEKPKGTLPKGYEPNAQGEPQDQDKKIWDKYYNGEIELPDVVKELKRYRSSEDTELETSDEDQREKDLKEYESSYLTRLEKNKPEESSDDFRVELGVSTESDDDLGKLNLRKHTVTKQEELQEERLAYEQKYLDRYAEPKLKKKASSSLYKPEKPKPKRNMKKERKEYEQKYLSRYKQPKANLRKPLNLKSDDLGRLNLRKHTIAKRSEYLAKRKDYEEKYILRYMKKLKAEPKRSSSKNLDHDLISGRLDLRAFVDKKRHEIKTERTEYEKKYISKYKESKASIKKSKSLTESDDLGKFTISTKTMALKKLRAERAEYEKQYLVRYSKQRKAKPKKKVASSSLYKPEIPKPKRDMRKERKKYEQKYLSRYKQPKANLRKPLNLKSDDLGRLNLRKHTIAKRSEYLAKRKDYEEKYILRYMKKLKAEPKRSSSKNLDHDLISGRLNLRAFVDKKRHEIKTERTEYEKKYISKYKESKASIKKSKSLTESDDLGKFTISTKTTALKKLRAERAEYEKQYLTRYSKQQKAKPKKKAVSSDLYKPEIPKPKRDMKKERKEYEQKYLARHLKQRKTKPKKKK